MISIEDEIPEAGVEVLATKPVGVGPLKRRSRVLLFNPNFTSLKIYEDMKSDGYTHWMYVPRIEE